MISSNYLFGAGGGEGGGGDLEDFSGGGHKVFSGNLGGGGNVVANRVQRRDCRKLTAN